MMPCPHHLRSDLATQLRVGPPLYLVVADLNTSTGSRDVEAVCGVSGCAVNSLANQVRADWARTCLGVGRTGCWCARKRPSLPPLPPGGPHSCLPAAAAPCACSARTRRWRRRRATRALRTLPPAPPCGWTTFWPGSTRASPSALLRGAGLGVFAEIACWRASEAQPGPQQVRSCCCWGRLGACRFVD